MVLIWDPGPNIRVDRHTFWANHRPRFWTRFRLRWPSRPSFEFWQSTRTDVSLLRALSSYVIAVGDRGGHFVGVARAPSRRSSRTHWYRRPLWAVGSDVIDCRTDWRAVRDRAYVLSLIGRKDSIESSAQCSLGTRAPSAYTQDYTADLPVHRVKGDFRYQADRD